MITTFEYVWKEQVSEIMEIAFTTCYNIVLGAHYTKNITFQNEYVTSFLYYDLYTLGILIPNIFQCLDAYNS